MVELNSSDNGQSSIFNFSLNQAASVLQEYLLRDRIFEKRTESIIITCYAILMALGIISNILTMIVIMRCKQRTNRNLFVLNLNLSDFALCIFCMPFTAMVLVRRHWPLGGVLCKLVPFIQGSTVFVSAATISAIAIDRYAIVTSLIPQKKRRHEKRVMYFIIVIWILSLTLSTPVCISQTVNSVGIAGITMYERCVEYWPSSVIKRLYTIVIVMSQYIIPSTVLVVMHFRIKAYLNLTLFQNNFRGSRKDCNRLQKELLRNRRATMILMNITVLFAISWLPWNVVNLIADFHPSIMSPSNLYLTFAVCHIIAMTSAATNPILYGWLNINVRKELLSFGRKISNVLPLRKKRDSRNGFIHSTNICLPVSDTLRLH